MLSPSQKIHKSWKIPKITSWPLIASEHIAPPPPDQKLSYFEKTKSLPEVFHPSGCTCRGTLKEWACKQSRSWAWDATGRCCHRNPSNHSSRLSCCRHRWPCPQTLHPIKYWTNLHASNTQRTCVKWSSSSEPKPNFPRVGFACNASHPFSPSTFTPWKVPLLAMAAAIFARPVDESKWK